MRGIEHGKTKIKLVEATTIGKGDMTRRWPEPAHLDAMQILSYFIPFGKIRQYVVHGRER